MRILNNVVVGLAMLGLGQATAQETSNQPPAQVQKLQKERTHGLQIDFKDDLSRDDILKALGGYSVHEMLPVSPSRNIHYVRLGSIHTTSDLLSMLRRTKNIESAQIAGSKPKIVTAADVARQVDEMLEADKTEYNLSINFKNNLGKEEVEKILAGLNATNVKLANPSSNTYHATVKTSLPLKEYLELVRKFDSVQYVELNIPKRSRF